MRYIVFCLSLFILISCATSPKRVYQEGQASWYGERFHGRKTASGEKFNMNELTAAHPKLPFGARVRVVNIETGQSVVVRINDRGPFAHNRIIDLSKAAAQKIGLVTRGFGRVYLYVVQEIQPLRGE